ncbi:hypothetical protein RhiirA5_419296 [Rhizophagus irregularis]|uniref:Uncharacterized protein n=3 Tax=Rhizophagus irregularis TaxID=588596 RepID=U9THU1_RHIID|nr:hypothetical protein GLOIN_2v1767270 [Rhizophagus irregularis DAOM 181602=DAOM 197198]ANQ32646.1 MATA-HMG [Rhizophagus irregularis]EXX64087.1 hypothetical protein RirG_146150 [Rhizophagus irregularis DAOM 197198w]ANQ32648.1 MATA-HMG [Rhizophagus irregularis]ANQ32649.1 MATA-HMG [Rhizophagus irregularis]PKC06632.1 hypothetical protein RhiirA5_419296 [Rhizophagus irregularis]|eukprot:XP_025184818.1 hypothetical protein GLOIN_2v1767270 [Rhizophagus irregularis DAOM 181602=DAOM 197198]
MSINEIPLINVPYPPELTVEEILSRRSEEKLGSKAPNRFFIYRVAYIKELRKRISNNISMTRISPYISLSWSKEPSEVKEAYKRLSELAENRLKEMRQRDTTPIFIHENFSPPSPPPSQPNNDIITNNNIIPNDNIIVDEPLFFYTYFDYYYDYYYYDYNNNCYYFY